MTRRSLWLWGPVVAVAAGIFALSHLQQPPGPSTAPDWLLHGIEYGVFAFLLARALAGGLGRAVTLRVAISVLLLGTAYGVVDEWHQSFVPSRDASAADVVADSAGSLFGVGLAALAGSLRRSREPALEVTLITGPGCALCDQARAALSRARRKFRLEIEERSIQDEPELRKLYSTRVPVVLAEQKVIAGGKFDEAALLRSLAARVAGNRVTT